VTPGELLLSALSQAGTRQATLARMTGLSPKHINQIVKGHAPMSAAVAVQIEEALGNVSAEDLMWLQVCADIAAARKLHVQVNVVSSMPSLQ
jgi:addiction module HigA family antidote